MKFLCVPCDSPMKLQTLAPPDGGSLSVVYSCPECGYEMAMLTNPFETQLVTSLGVRIGPDTNANASSVASASVDEPVANARPSGDEKIEKNASTSSGQCPFAAMIPAMQQGTPESAGHATPANGEEPLPVRWTSGAETRLANIPEFVRPMARTGIERFARERGSLEVDEKILDEAKDFFGM